MPNLFSKARDWLNPMLKEAAGVDVSYARVAGDPAFTLTAVVGRTAFATNGEIARIQFGDRDYLINRADLTVSGAEVLPAIGDRITETIDGVGVVFEVMTPDTGEPAWRWSDPARSVYRIHCKRVS